MNKIIWTCVNCEKINNTSLGSLKAKQSIILSFQEENEMLIKCKKCGLYNNLTIKLKITGLNQETFVPKNKRTTNMIKINKERAKEKKKQIFSLLNGLFIDTYLNEKGEYDIDKIAKEANVSIKTAKKYINEFMKK
ncbi:hypothetical protein HL736_001197 [Campylobacter lari]|nr:hypothetical protein [Campylobacter lari]